MANVYTTFPESVQRFDLKTDVSSDIHPYWVMFNNYISAGQFDEAASLLLSQPSLQSTIVNSVYINRISKTLEEVQDMFLNNVQSYIREIVVNKGTFSASVKYAKYNFVSYSVNGVVGTYECLRDDTPIGTLPTNTTYWVGRVIQGEKGASGLGLAPRGMWATGTLYNVNDFVVYDKGFWQCLKQNTSSAPTESNANWLLLISFKGELATLLATHDVKINTAAGAHGIRYYNNELQYNATGSQWTTIKTGGGGSYIGTSAPADTTLLWIDSSSGGVMKYYNGSAWVTTKATWG